MKKNAIKISLIMVATVLLLTIISTVGYVIIGRAKIHDKAQEYLRHKGYTQTENMNIDVKHSFLNIILSYDEWVIHVKFTDEQDTIYYFTYKDNAIIPRGFSGAYPKNISKFQ